LGEFGIPVYEVRPEIVMTNMTAVVKEQYDRLIAKGLTIQPRWGFPEDIGKAVAMLVRGDLVYSTGQVIMVDGGLCQGKQRLHTQCGGVGAGAPPVCYPWRNRASGIPPVD